MKYILVHWSATNNTTVLTEEFVRDKSMLNDPKKKGMIRYGTIGAKPPNGGWKAYFANKEFCYSLPKRYKQIRTYDGSLYMIPARRDRILTVMRSCL